MVGACGELQRQHAAHGGDGALSAEIAHKWQMQDAPPAPETDGTLFVSMDSGRGVDGGVRERMKREDAVEAKR